MHKYKILTKLGEGSFGQVYKAGREDSNEIVALKCIKKHGRTKDEIASLRKECDIQWNLNHPNIIQMLDSFETEAEIVVVTELAHTDLFRTLAKGKRLDEKKTGQITSDLVSALYYLHTKRILHRDLKPQNILLSKSGMAKLCDFGFARNMSIGTHVLTSIKGTPLYMAPELIEESPYDQTADLWSLGCIVYEMVVGSPPFKTNNIFRLVERIKSEEVKWPPDVSDKCLSFLEGLLEKNPANRLSWPHLLEHPFVKEKVFIPPDLCLGDKLPLTAPLTSSQAQAKELQKQDLKAAGNGYSEYCSEKRRLSTKLTEENAEKRRLSNKLSDENTDKLRLSNKLSEENMDKRRMSSKLSKENTDKRRLSNKFMAEATDRRRSSNKLIEGDTESYLTHEITTSNVDDEDLSRRLQHMNINQMPAEQPNTDEIDTLCSSQKELQEILKLDEACQEVCIKSHEEEEWLVFLQQSMEEIMNGDGESISNTAFVNMVCRALNSTSVKVVNYIACLFSIPFAVDSFTEAHHEKIRKGYAEVKLVPRLIYATQFITKRHKSESSLNTDELQTLEIILLLISDLVHSEDVFVEQFCKVSRILRLSKHYVFILSLQRKKVRIAINLMAILGHILRRMPENKFIALDFVNTLENPECEFRSMLNNNSEILAVRTLLFLNELSIVCTDFVKLFWSDYLQRDIEALRYSPDDYLRSVANNVLVHLFEVGILTDNIYINQEGSSE